jgi:hypothetical protein
MSIAHRPYVNLVVLGVRSDPFDEYDPMLIIDADHQSVIVPFDVENHSVRTNDTAVPEMGTRVPGGKEIAP